MLNILSYIFVTPEKMKHRQTKVIRTYERFPFERTRTYIKQVVIHYTVIMCIFQTCNRLTKKLQINHSMKYYFVVIYKAGI